MRLSKIVLSGANEHTDAKALVNLCNQYVLSEIGIQVSGDKASFGSARYWWIWTLCFLATRKTNIALHLNKDWVEAFCAGEIPSEVKTFLSFKHPDGTPIINRIQLNFKIGREKTPDINTLLRTMTRCNSHKFILSYNDSNKDLISRIYQSGFKIDALLYDSSFGEGVAPTERPVPAFSDVYQGYAGGLSPENIVDELKKINAAVPPNRSFFIDAEGKLKGSDNHLSLKKSEVYLKKASEWSYQYL